MVADIDALLDADTLRLVVAVLDAGVTLRLAEREGDSADALELAVALADTEGSRGDTLADALEDGDTGLALAVGEGVPEPGDMVGVGDARGPMGNAYVTPFWNVV